jgi:hypothetical protein
MRFKYHINNMETQDNPKVDDKIVFMSVDEEHTISIDYHCVSCLNVMNGMGVNQQFCYVTSTPSVNAWDDDVR